MNDEINNDDDNTTMMMNNNVRENDTDINTYK